jgi:hypothetical protein
MPLICADDSGGEACSASVAPVPRRTALVMIATRTSFRMIFMVIPAIRVD